MTILFGRDPVDAEVETVLSLPGTLYPDTCTSVLYLSASSPVAAGAGIGCGVLVTV